MEDCIRASQSHVVLLRLVDCDEKSVMGYLAQAFSYVKIAIKDNFGNNKREYNPILDIVEKRWALHFNDHPPLSA